MRWFWVSRPTSPKSRKMIRPVSGSTKMLPGCGSPWKKPSTRTCLISALTNTTPISLRSMPAASRAATLLILKPFTNSAVMTRSPDSSPYTTGTCIRSNLTMASEIRRAL